MVDIIAIRNKYIDKKTNSTTISNVENKFFEIDA